MRGGIGRRREFVKDNMEVEGIKVFKIMMMMR